MTPEDIAAVAEGLYQALNNLHDPVLLFIDGKPEAPPPWEIDGLLHEARVALIDYRQHLQERSK